MSPAGYWPQLRAAVEAGADAVYFGLKHFTARAKVGFDLRELPEVMRTLHSRGVRGYVTFNTLIFQHELSDAAKAIEALAGAGVDALIVQDIGITKLARRIAPSLELHASTQMSITSSEGVKIARGFGVDRVTLARELSLEEIARIYKETGCDLEIFVHGALCVAYSGQCFSSEAWGGRSANRGQCAQACRLPYELIVDGELHPLADARYLLSPGDLYALEQVPEITRIGVAALKIEGRYKDADYVALTTRAYRRAVDAAWAGLANRVTDEERLQLEQVYSRGLAPHFLTGTNHQAVVQGRAPRHRGVLVGTVVDVDREGRVWIDPAQAHYISPVKPGDGLVFDAASWRSPGETEEGGRVYQAVSQLDGLVELGFGNRALRPERIRVGDLVWRSHDPELDRVVKPLLEATIPMHRQRVLVRAIAHEGQPLQTEWWLERLPDVRVFVESPTVLGKAQNRALARELLLDQFGRLGNTAYELAGVEVEIGGQPFAASSMLNSIRREAVEKLAELQAAPLMHSTMDAAAALAATMHPAPPTETAPPELHLLVRMPEQLDAAIQLRPASITLDYLDLYGLRPSVDRVRAGGVPVRVASPRILKPGEARIQNFLLDLQCPILVRGAGMLEPLANKAELIGDFSLNAANSLTAEALLQMGLKRITPTHDLNAVQVAELACTVGAENVEAIAYQHLPVFHTEHCVFCRFLSEGTSFKDCGRPCEEHRIALKDQNGRAHPVMADVGCRNTVFGAEAQQASAHFTGWRKAGIRHFRLEFVHETPEEVREIAELWRAALDGAITPAQLDKQLRRVSPEGVTEGSLYVPANYLVFPILQ